MPAFLLKFHILDCFLILIRRFADIFSFFPEKYDFCKHIIRFFLDLAVKSDFNIACKENIGYGKTV